MVVYLDVLFGVNLLMDYITLLAAARLGGACVRRWRLLAGAATGALYAMLAAVQPWLAVWPLRLLAGGGMCAAAFAGQRAFGRLCALYLVVAAGFAGLAGALGTAAGRQLRYGAGYYFVVPLRVLLLAAAVSYAVSGVLLRDDARHGVLRREVERLTIRFAGREQAVRVLHDTGNALTEPVGGRPVVVLERAVGEALLGVDGLPPDAVAQLDSLPPDLAGRCGLLPYHAVGTEHGLLLYFRPDAVCRADGRALDCVCAVGPAQIGRGAYDGLIGV
ncbi:MAG: sigma-E processing peptidase SpoIIGA [Eubacteriales bacterium]|nr:sigma-E processing peptidase SpoIIGA [Eubacteriales bacterium]